MVYIVGLLFLMVLIIGHEFGHFIVAKAAGVCVTEFSVGMGPLLFSHKSKSGTVYSVRAGPIGGFCSMKGESEINTSDTDSFSQVSVWARILIVLAGPLFNILIAYILCWCVVAGAGQDVPVVTKLNEQVADGPLRVGDVIVSIDGTAYSTSKKVALASGFFHVWEDVESVQLTVERHGQRVSFPYDLPHDDKYMFGVTQMSTEDGVVIVSFINDSVLEKAGAKQGDIIVSIDGVPLTEEQGWDKLFNEDNPVEGRPYDVVLKRDDETFTVTVTPQFRRDYWLGFALNTDKQPVNVWTGALDELDYSVYLVTGSVKELVTGRTDAGSVSGPVAIVSALGDEYNSVLTTESSKQGDALVSLLTFLAMISVNLGLLNLLPIPALDGGRLVFLIIEAVRRKPVKPEVEMTVHRYGLLVLMLLSVIIIIKDLLPIWKNMFMSLAMLFT